MSREGAQIMEPSHTDPTAVQRPARPGSVAVVVPIYQAHLSPLEQFSLQHSLAQLRPDRAVYFVGPQGLDYSQYTATFPSVPVITFETKWFESIKGYSRLLLNRLFYERFARYEFMLLLQTDAILLRDDLDQWCASPYDYVGAPWPDGIEIFVNVDQFSGAHGKRVKSTVGNGGLSLRRISQCLALLEEFPQAIQLFEVTGSSEDIFFGVMGALSRSFLVPNEITASTFALELTPEYYFHINGQSAPMGGHAWWKYSPGFWLDLIGPAADGVRQHITLPPATAQASATTAPITTVSTEAAHAA
jgi:hypothetical protein